MKIIVAALAAPLIALSAGAGIASASVSAADLQQLISSQLAAQAGTPPNAVDCPEDLATDIGSSTTCAVTFGDETRGFTITVVSVDNGQPNLSIALARQ